MSDLALAILAEMRDSASRAVEYARSGGERWYENDMILDAVANRIRQLTELAKYQFPEDEKGKYSQIPWDELARARDFYTHHYKDLDIERLRTTVEHEVPDLLAVLSLLDLPDFEENPTME